MTAAEDFKMDKASPPLDASSIKSKKSQSARKLSPTAALGLDVAICAALTAWLVVAWLRNPNRMGLPAFLYFCIVTKIATKRISNETLSAPFALVFGVLLAPFQRFSNFVLGAMMMGTAMTIAVLAICVIPESSNGGRLDRLRSLCGLCLIIGTMFLTSKVHFNFLIALTEPLILEVYKQGTNLDVSRFLFH
jgi:CNT family concentrative nucleoside transporter